jgi:hypothetical protein
MANKLKIDKKYFLMDSEQSDPNLNTENDPNTVRFLMVLFFFLIKKKKFLFHI